ncbi:MAG: hypothetical protein LC623_08645 [Halobacteriales archaeon]|nr:hypothetical protein [Halobacteriales archaeon]
MALKVRIPTANGGFLEAEGNPEELAAYSKAMAAVPAPVKRAQETPPVAKKAATKTTAKATVGNREPDAQKIESFILECPDYTHTMNQIFEAQAGGPIPSLVERNGKKIANALYGRWVHHTQNARKAIEEKKGGSFSIDWRNGVRFYVFMPNRGS